MGSDSTTVKIRGISRRQTLVRQGAGWFATLVIFCGLASSQEASVSASRPYAAVTSPVIRIAAPERPTQPSFRHPFWDKQNLALFSATAALNLADFAVTRANLQQGGAELNPVVRIFGRSTAGLATNFAGETAGVIAISYLFHKTGHHKLERIASMVNLGASSGAVAYGLATR